MFLYPLLYPLTGFGQRQFGIYIGSTVHEVAQVVAAGRAISGPTADTAVITKMVRVLLLAPVLVIVGRLRGRKSNAQRKDGAAPSFPWFVLGFAGVILLQSIVAIHGPLRSALLNIDTVLLGSAMFALGLGTRWTHLKSTGVRPLLLGTVLFGALITEGFVLTSTLIR
jgi:uncharacterized integral membrane protein (TIGR00698 family)